MQDDVALKDAVLKRWLDGAFPVLGNSLGLPPRTVSAARSALQATPVDDLMRWTEELGLDSGERIRRLVEDVPDAAQKLDSTEGRKSLLRWEQAHEAAPVLEALRLAVEEVVALWRGGGVPRSAVIRLLAALAVSPVIPGGDAFKVRLAQVLGTDCSDAASLIREVARLAVVGERVVLEQADEFIQQEPVLARWLQDFLVALEAAVLERRPGGATRGFPLESGLVDILADLLRAALAWEAEHGLPTGQEQSHAQEWSTGMPNAVH